MEFGELLGVVKSGWDGAGDGSIVVGGSVSGAGIVGIGTEKEGDDGTTKLGAGRCGSFFAHAASASTAMVKATT